MSAKGTDIKQKLVAAIAIAKDQDAPLSVEFCEEILTNICVREEYAALLKEQARRLRGAVAAGFLHVPGAGTDLIDLAQLAEDLEYASRRSLGDDSHG